MSPFRTSLGIGRAAGVLRRSLAVAAGALCLLGLVSCKPIGYYLAQVYKVHGTVSVAGTQGATPVGSVEVFVGDSQYSELTNYYGDYELEMAAGTWTVNFLKDGFEAASAVVTVGPDAPRVELDMEMVPIFAGGTVTVSFTDALVAEGGRALVAVYPAGIDPTPDPIGLMVGGADFDIVGGSGGQVLEVPWSEVLGEIWYGTDGESYDLYLWVDMNGNLQDGVYYPEPGIDLRLTTYPLVITIAGDLLLSFTGNDLVLAPFPAAADGTISVGLTGASEHDGKKFAIVVFAAGVRDPALLIGLDSNNIVDGAATNIAFPSGAVDPIPMIFTGGESYDILALIFAGDYPVAGDLYAEINGVVVDGNMMLTLVYPQDFTDFPGM